MRPATAENIEDKFASLSPEEKASVISHGVALRLSEWKKRLFLAELDAKGLPDDAGHEMHEDYIMWHHWAEVVDRAGKQVSALQVIATYGVQC